jgi:hypothetical protein
MYMLLWYNVKLCICKYDVVGMCMEYLLYGDDELRDHISIVSC